MGQVGPGAINSSCGKQTWEWGARALQGSEWGLRGILSSLPVPPCGILYTFLVYFTTWLGAPWRRGLCFFSCSWNLSQIQCQVKGTCSQVTCWRDEGLVELEVGSKRCGRMVEVGPSLYSKKSSGSFMEEAAFELSPALPLFAHWPYKS